MTRLRRSEMRRSKPASMIGAMHTLGRFSSTSGSATSTCPTAVVVTTGDQLVRAGAAVPAWPASIPGATVHEADTDHFGCVLGAAAFLPALLDACASVTSRAPLSMRI